MKNIPLYIYLLLSLLLITHALEAEYSGSDFINLSTSVPSLAIGQSGSAYLQGLQGVYLNPCALINMQNNNQIMLMYSQWILDMSYAYAGYSHKINNSAWALGLMYHTSEGLQEQLENTEGIYISQGNNISINNYYGHFTYTYEYQKLSGGITAKYIRQELYNILGKGLAFDLGLKYRFPKRSFYFIPDAAAVSYHNLSSGIKYPVHTSSIAQYINFGLYYNLIWNMKLISDINNSNGGLNLNLGYELSFQKKFFIRTGYASLFQEQKNNFLSGLSYGAGISLELISIDYVFISEAYENVQSLSLMLKL